MRFDATSIVYWNVADTKPAVLKRFIKQLTWPSGCYIGKSTHLIRVQGQRFWLTRKTERNRTMSDGKVWYIGAYLIIRPIAKDLPYSSTPETDVGDAPTHDDIVSACKALICSLVMTT